MQKQKEEKSGRNKLTHRVKLKFTKIIVDENLKPKRIEYQMYYKDEAMQQKTESLYSCAG